MENCTFQQIIISIQQECYGFPWQLPTNEGYLSIAAMCNCNGSGDGPCILAIFFPFRLVTRYLVYLSSSYIILSAPLEDRGA